MSTPFRGPRKSRDAVAFNTTIDREVLERINQRARQFKTSRVQFIEIAACLLDSQDDEVIRSLLATVLK